MPGESIDSGRSTQISTSSAGDRLAVPPQARQPRCSRTISASRSIGSSTLAHTSMVSAVPAGEVIARDEVLGHSMPWGGHDRHHQHRGAVAGDAADAVLVHPPGARRQSMRWPTAAMASVRKYTSSRSSSRAWLVATRRR